LNPFLQQTAEKKDSKNIAARKFFGPSYFVTALGAFILFLEGTGYASSPGKIWRRRRP
jgi:hypothetical protein